MAKTLLADCSPPLEHPEVFGNFNAISSMGFIVGPLIGGHLAMQENGFTKVTFVASTLFFLSFLFVWFYVEETPVPVGGPRREEVHMADEAERRENDSVARQRTTAKDQNGTPSSGSDHGSERTTPSFLNFLKIASASNILDLLIIRFVMSFAMLMFRSNFSSALEFRYGTSPKTNGYIMSYNGILSACSGFLVGPLMSKLYHNNDAKMLLHSSILLTLSILGLTLSPSVSTLVLFIAPLSLGSAVSRVCVTNLTFRRGNKDERGLLQGIGNSLTSTARMVAPFLGGLAQECSIFGPGMFGVGFATIGVAIIFFSPHDRQAVDEKKKAD